MESHLFVRRKSAWWAMQDASQINIDKISFVYLNLKKNLNLGIIQACNEYIRIDSIGLRNED